ncbi:MAG: DUF3847 domain-containing protein [Oscillospiraceae bacterium]|nr:DUF3847 domain-containing protein [Oscillospiraceae bacterium]
MGKTKVERITSIEDQIAQLENQRKQLVQKHKEDERKARTRRLIQRGALLESFISDPAEYTEEQIKTFLKETLDTEFARKALRRIKHPQRGEVASARADTTPQQAAGPALSGEGGGTGEDG